MGVINPEPMTLSSGITLCNCYLSFTPGPLAFPAQPPPMSFRWTVDPVSGDKAYQASACLYIYTSHASKAAGLDAVETRLINVPAGAADAMVGGTFAVFFANLQAQYPNCTDSPPAD